LFEQNNGDLNKSIETILRLQANNDEVDKDKSEGTEDTEVIKPQPVEGGQEKGIDKASQELIDEMLAE